MPIITDSESSEMDDLYSEDASETVEESTDTMESVEPHSELVSKKLLLGKSVKPGDKVILTVVKDFGDEVELAYKDDAEEPEETGMTEDEELEALSE